MPTLIRVRQLATGGCRVETAILTRGKSALAAAWEEARVFPTERDAELYARSLADRESGDHPNDGRGMLGICDVFPRPSARYWLYPKHSCRMELL